jgi:hypothetical protein
LSHTRLLKAGANPSTLGVVDEGRLWWVVVTAPAIGAVDGATDLFQGLETGTAAVAVILKLSLAGKRELARAGVAAVDAEVVGPERLTGRLEVCGGDLGGEQRRGAEKYC